MAKKRKLRSSDPEPTKQPEPEPQQQDVIEPEPTSDQNENHQNMAVDEEIAPIQEDQPQIEEEAEPEGEEEHQQQEENETLENQQNAGEVSEQVETVETNGADDSNNNEEEEDLDLEEEPVEKLLEPFTKEQLHALVKQSIEKYPDLAENVRQLADVDPAHRKIFVHGLGWDATAETLTTVFSKYGEIEDCKAVTDKLSGKSKGYAFILFKHRTGCRRALKQPQKKIGNRTTSCQLASAGPVPAPPPNGPPVSEYTQRKIFVSNVSSDIDPQKLLEFFKQFGEVEDGPLGIDKMTGRPKGFALFVYKTVESAKKALEEANKTFEGHTLYCQKAVDGPKGYKGYHNQQPQHQQHHSHHSHHSHHQPHYNSRKDKNKYSSGGGPSHGGAGHLMAPPGPAVGGYNPGVPAQGLNPALGQALSALLANQGAGLGLGNLLGGLGGAPVNQAGPPPAAYGNQAAMGYGNQPGLQPQYQNPQMGQSSGVRPHPGPGAPYMGH
ncbi:UBP1-associated protein 2B-like [Cicer arietinum]|uniref:UBP1-associated protein 2B-like n=1 Tax=Cicer arietinum TaxID=3827 RepID=A0A1S3E0K9_CICAR|nr:UBP1-associated protein 2B-like [Cicer arietinum]XP_012568617.1 UBP1-associated protein 2B-like [Cicer arietinum]XP_027187793.1 UBP1-associated protein 2B-like [Cicer arietinum]XP_027187794.1 UBP1-associated protein 2B-like [Cicer arietinum]